MAVSRAELAERGKWRPQVVSRPMYRMCIFLKLSKKELKSVDVVRYVGRRCVIVNGNTCMYWYGCDGGMDGVFWALEE